MIVETKRPYKNADCYMAVCKEDVENGAKVDKRLSNERLKKWITFQSFFPNSARSY